MVDTQRLNKAIQSFVYESSPKGYMDETCTKKELDDTVNNLATVLRLFVEEISK